MPLTVASESLAVRKLRRRARRAIRWPWAQWLAPEPETIVRVPPFDDAFVAAVKLIAPQYTDYGGDEESRRKWQRDQNRSCWGEDTALVHLLRVMPPPRRVLEIGAGLGRSAVFFSKRYFPDARFDLFDATGADTKYELMGNRYDDSFCGNLAVLQQCLDFNGVSNVSLVDAAQTGGRVPMPDERYDFIYSFYSVGFHWSIDHWLDEILAVAKPTALCAFIVPSHYQPSRRVAAMPHMLIEGAPLLQPDPYSTTYVLVFTPQPAAWFQGATRE